MALFGAFLFSEAVSGLASTLIGMAATEYEAVPAVDADAQAAHLGTVVMKFGGTSVGDPEKLKRVAARLVAARNEGHRVVGVLSAMGHTTDELLDLAHQISNTPHPRELDMLVSVGERISCALAAMVIHDLGHEAISLTGSQAGIVTDTVHGKAKIVEVRARRIHEALDEGTIVLVAGFQGVSTAFEVTTLGRGGSDTTAVALAAALGADHCEIYTDVLGVYSADPRVVPDARQLTRVSFDEMLEMASSGAGVMATRSIEVARSHNVRLHVRSSFEEGDGTWIQHEDTVLTQKAAMLEKALISGVVHQREETVYRVEGTTAARLFGALAEASVNVDTIVQTNAEIVFSAPVEDRADASRTLDALGVAWTSRDDLGKVSLVGAGMKSHPGVAAKTFATLEEAGIEASIVSTSPIKIACHVPSSDVDKAVQLLHEAFELG
jgi:aspartate kinase